MLNLLTHIKNRNFQRLWFAQIISQFGDRIHQLALVGLIAQRDPGSAMGLAKMLAFTILPVFIIQPIAGVFVDRWDRRVTLFICDIVRGLLILAIPFVFIYWESLVPIYIIVFIVFSFSRFYVPAKMSIIPDLVEEDNLLSANSLVTTTGMIAFCLGAALGGFLIEQYGARNGFLIDAMTYMVSAVFLFSMNLPKRLKKVQSQLVDTGRQIIEVEKSFFAELKEGLKYLIEHREIRLIINVGFILFSAVGAVYVVIVVFIQNAFGSVTKDLGILAVFLGIGLFVGVLLYGKWGKRFVWHKTIFFCLIVGGVMLTVFSLCVHYYSHLVMAMALAFVLGMVIGPIFVASNTMIHLVSDENMRGKVFSALEIVIHFAFLVTMFISSYLSEIIDPVWILCAVGSIVITVGIYGFTQTKNHRGLAFSE